MCRECRSRRDSCVANLSVLLEQDATCTTFTRRALATGCLDRRMPAGSVFPNQSCRNRPLGRRMILPATPGLLSARARTCAAGRCGPKHLAASLCYGISRRWYAPCPALGCTRNRQHDCPNTETEEYWRAGSGSDSAAEGRWPNLNRPHPAIHPIIYVTAATAAVQWRVIPASTQLFLLTGAILFIKQEFSLSTAQMRMIGVAVLLGAALGTLLGGTLTDRLGRRWVIIGAAATSAASAVGAASFSFVVKRQREGYLHDGLLLHTLSVLPSLAGGSLSGLGPGERPVGAVRLLTGEGQPALGGTTSKEERACVQPTADRGIRGSRWLLS